MIALVQKKLVNRVKDDEVRNTVSALEADGQGKTAYQWVGP